MPVGPEGKVTPGGPADQAGIKADDIIVKFNGTQWVDELGRKMEKLGQSQFSAGARKPSE